MGFNLNMIKGVAGNGLLNEESKKLAQKTMSIKYIPMDEIDPNRENFYSIAGIDGLANLIKLSGLQQPLVVMQKEDGRYLLLTGERRLTAIKKLHENGDWGDVVPCIIQNLDDMDLPLSDDKKLKMNMMVTNQMRDKTDADIATEIREWKEIYSELRKKGIECISLGKNDKGEEIKQEIKGKKTRELISEQLGISNGQIAKYEKVEKNGSSELKEKFEKNEISVAVAEKVASLPAREQKDFLGHVPKGENVTSPMVAEYIGETKNLRKEGFELNLKNEKERKKFLKGYQEWPVWFQVPQASEVYYRYDLPDGYSIVVCEYRYYLEWMEKEVTEDSEQVGIRIYLLTPGYKYLYNCRSNETAVLKHLQQSKM